MSSSENTNSLNFSSIESLNGGNYKKWRQDVEIMLGLMDHDLALRENAPSALTSASTAEDRVKHEKWHKANRMSLMVMKKTMSETVREGIPACDKAKDFLDDVGAKFKVSENAGMGNLMITSTWMLLEKSRTLKSQWTKLLMFIWPSIYSRCI